MKGSHTAAAKMEKVLPKEELLANLMYLIVLPGKEKGKKEEKEREEKKEKEKKRKWSKE